MTAPRRLIADDSGSTLVEFAVVVALFLLLIFGLVDFGRLGFSYVMAEKATQRAVRIAAVSPPACAGLPALNTRALLSGLGQTIRNGTPCTAISGLCRNPGTIACNGSNGNATAAAIWGQVRPLLPVNASIANLRFTYQMDPALGYLGGSYTPVVTVNLNNLDFQFITPLGQLAALAGANPDPDLGAGFRFPGMSSSLPAEDLR